MPQRTLTRRRRHEEDYDDEPTTRDDATSVEDDDEDEAPRSRGRSRRSRDADDDAPRSRRRGTPRDADDDEDDAPRSRRSRRSRDEDDEEDDAPRGRRSAEPKERMTSTLGKGWGGYKEVKDSGSDYVKTWKLPGKPTLVKVLDAEPFATYAEHWLDGITKGKKSFVCLREDCPLCDDLGDRPTGYALFNILDLSDPDHPTVEVWKAGKRVAGILEEYALDKKTGPLDRVDVYFSVFKSGDKGGNSQTNINPVKARDLDEDWDCDPFSEEELDEFQRYTEDQVVTLVPRKQLKAVAADYDD